MKNLGNIKLNFIFSPLESIEDVKSKFGDYYNFTLKSNEALMIENYFVALILGRSNFTNYKMLDQTPVSAFEGIALIYGHPINEAINEIISVLLESGIMDYWIANATYLKADDLDTGPQVLTLDHLFIGFAIWLIALASAVVVFLIEVVCNMIKQRLEAQHVIKPFVN